MSTSNAEKPIAANRKWYEAYKLATVEPPVMLYMLAFMITNVVEQAFFVHKACRVNHGYEAAICDNLHEKKYEAIKYEVQVTVSNFLQWNDLAANLVPIVLVMFVGSWSDRRGRKIPLLMGLTGKFIYSLMIIVNTLQPTWRLEYVIFTATIPMALSGADVVIFAAAYSYLSDVTSVQNRTSRITILDVSYLSTLPVGIALGRYLFSDVTNRSFTILFTINASLCAISILYSVKFLKWQTTDKQRPLSDAQDGILADFFDINHVTQAIKCFGRKRTKNGGAYLLPFLLTTMFYRFQREEKNYTYLFFPNEMGWDYDKYSNYRTFQSALIVLFMLLGVPFMQRRLKFRDTVLVLIGVTSHVTARLINIFAKHDWLFYFGAVVCSLGPIVGPATKSMISKAISPTERGRVFSIISVADNSVPLFSGFMYSQLYNATVKTAPASFWWLTITTQIIIFAIILGVHLTSTDASLAYHEPPEITEQCLPLQEQEEKL